MRRLLLAAILFCSSLLQAEAQTADYRVVPLPQDINISNGLPFTLNAGTRIVYNGNSQMKRNAQFLAQYIKEKTGFELDIVKSRRKKENAITLTTGNAGENPEGYTINVDS